ncbi:MAG: glycosyltransferase, partial [Clostridia bacterium]|nr:glycosyltransferase [Clostridia bacterium]
MGFGNVVKDILSIDDLEEDFQILCVCGRNEKMKAEIESIRWNKKVKSYGFVDNVDVMMDASDLIITKPGGLTSSEFLAKELPAIIMNPIPGQENRNTEFLVNNGAAVMVTDTFSLEEALFQMMENKGRIELLRKSVEILGKPEATKDVCEFVMKLAKGEN